MSFLQTHLTRFADFCGRLTGWRKYLWLYLCGAVSALAMAPTYCVFVLFAAFPALFFTLKAAKNKKQSFFSGWFFGLGFFSFGLYWISFALFVDFATWWWVLPFALFALPMALAIFTGGATLCAWILSRNSKSDFTLYFALTSFLSIAELGRGFLFTGFPWNLWGYGWMGSLAMAQNLSWGGIYSLTCLTLIWALSPIFLRQSTPYHAVMPVLTCISMLLCYGYGTYRLANADSHPIDDRYHMRIVQPNIPQNEKWQRHKQWDNFDQLIALSSAQSAQPLTHIIWPETALTISPEYNEEVRLQLSNLLSTTHPQALLMTGNIRVDGKNFYNSFRIYDQSGLPQASFDKSHLVPFGEYIPFRSLINISPLGSQISGTADFSSGNGPYIATYPNTPIFSPLICYEVLFPQKAIKKAQNVELLINATNDGWYGHTSGPYQHLAISQARAIETGRPLIRAAGTGISAYIDPFGRVASKASLSTSNFIDLSIHKTINTYYSIHLLLVFALILTLLAITIACQPKKQTIDNNNKNEK